MSSDSNQQHRVSAPSSEITPWQRLFPRINYYLINGVLVLWGVVATDAIRLQAEEVAWQNFGAESVVNQIETEPGK